MGPLVERASRDLLHYNEGHKMRDKYVITVDRHLHHSVVMAESNIHNTSSTGRLSPQVI